MGAIIKIIVDSSRPRFNPRTRDGCDNNLEQCEEMAACFNPRTRDGCDMADEALGKAVNVSIHAPVMGAIVYYWHL